MSFNGFVWASWIEPTFVIPICYHTTSLHGLSLNLPFSVPAAPTAVAVAVRDPVTAAAKTIV